MSSNRAMELFQELVQVDNRRDAIRAELAGLLGFSTGDAPAAPAPAKKPAQKSAPSGKPAKAQRTVKVKDGDGTEKAQPSLKEVVKTILGNHPDGLELREIVTEVTGMIERKEYVSNAKNVTAVVSQAISQLQADKLIVGEKSPDTKRNRYHLAPAA